jgi:hypothetical protein
MTKQSGAVELNAQQSETCAPNISPDHISESHHQRICKICKHPERAFIEQEFIHWYSPERIARDYNIPERAIYRHAHATGLFERRRRNLRFLYETFLEHAQHVRITGGDVLRAARAYTRINDQGQWIEPPTTHFVVASAAPPDPPGSTTRVPRLPAQAVADATPTPPELPRPANQPAVAIEPPATEAIEVAPSPCDPAVTPTTAPPQLEAVEFPADSPDVALDGVPGDRPDPDSDPPGPPDSSLPPPNSTRHSFRVENDATQ